MHIYYRLDQATGKIIIQSMLGSGYAYLLQAGSGYGVKSHQLRKMPVNDNWALARAERRLKTF